MNEQTKTDHRTAVPVPPPWRWGWWKYHVATNEVELRPLNEVEEINDVTGIFALDTSVVLTHRDYGDRFRVPQLGKTDDPLPDWNWTADGKVDWDHPYGVLSAMFATNATHVITSTVLATKPVRDLIAAAPELLAMCERLANLAEHASGPAGADRDFARELAQEACALIAHAKGEDE